MTEKDNMPLTVLVCGCRGIEQSRNYLIYFRGEVRVEAVRKFQTLLRAGAAICLDQGEAFVGRNWFWKVQPTFVFPADMTVLRKVLDKNTVLTAEVRKGYPKIAPWRQVEYQRRPHHRD